MRAREWAFVLASAWVGAVAFCSAVRALCGCAPAGQVYVPARDFRWRGDPARGAARISGSSSPNEKDKYKKRNLPKQTPRAE